MSEQFPELERARVSVDEQARARQLAAIDAAIRQQLTPRPRRLRLLAVTLALVLLVPVMALAAEDSVPGDFLYPVKRAVEPVVSLFDREVVATNRISETERLILDDAPIDLIRYQLDQAHAAVDRLDPVDDETERAIEDLDRMVAIHDSAEQDHVRHQDRVENIDSPQELVSDDEELVPDTIAEPDFIPDDEVTSDRPADDGAGTHDGAHTDSSPETDR